MDSEKLLEKKLSTAISQMGGLALKLSSFTFTGLPDRLILLPNARVAFCELKSTGQKQSPRQVIVSEKLRRMGFEVRVVDSLETLQAFIDFLTYA